MSRTMQWVVLGVMLVSSLAHAEIPQVISYQGKVTDATGTPVADGPYTMRFRIYDAVNAGTLKWDSNAQTVAVAGGVFSVLLGESPQPALTLAFDQDYWLQVTFGGVDQAPRQPIASTGYAYVASGLVPGTEVLGSVTTGSRSAIKGVNTATSGGTSGLHGVSHSGTGSGIYGEAIASSGITYGVYGRCSSVFGRGVFGLALATTGVNYGLVGESLSPEGWGGYFAGGQGGIWGETPSTSGRAVCGIAEAVTGTTYGGFFRSSSVSGMGVVANAVAQSGTTYGAFCISQSPTGTGVFGYAGSTTGSPKGVCGQSDSSSGYGVYYSGGLAGTGTKSCVVRTSQGPTLMYCQESPENWFEDFGEGQLVSGRCRIELDPLFLETVTIDAANPMHVFVQPYDESCRDLVVKRSGGGFDVVNPTQPDAGGAFSYRVVAKRKGFEGTRLEVCEAARTDSYLYPELREKERAEPEAERIRINARRNAHEGSGAAR